MKIRFEDAARGAEQSRGLHVDYVAAKRNIPAWRWNLIVLLLASPVLYLLGSTLLEQIWITAPGVVELKEAKLHAGQSGRIASILPEGSRVAAGAPLAVLAPPPAPLPAPAAPVEKPVPNRAGAQLLAYRRERARCYRELFQAGAATQAELASALGQLAEAESAYRPARREPTPPPEVAVPRNEAVAVAAPYDGVVAQVAASAGDWVAAGSELLTLVDDRQAHIVAYLDPRHSRYAEPGRRARLKFPDGHVFPARVAEVRVKAVRLAPVQTELFKGGRDALQLVLAPDEDLPAAYRRQQLPVEVTFELEMPWGGVR